MDETPPIIRRRRKRGRRRHSDGTLAGNNNTIRVTDRSLVARWLDAETIRLKRMGMSFQVIRDHVIEVSRGTAQPLTPLNGAVFKPGWTIGVTGMFAFHRGMELSPKIQA